jgi:hypothetical protein
MQKKKVLFILKRREDYNAEKHSHIGLSTGLFNSASFMNNMLVDDGVDSELVVVTDNNCIDREVTKHKPTHVIIEALWVVPTKFTVLCKLHPNVKWIIRLHSEMPFLANEGMALDWIGDYAKFDNLILGVNAPRALGEVRDFVKSSTELSEDEINEKIIYLPNYYPQEMKHKKYEVSGGYVDISCFGAVRPLKNHIIQAIAAIKFAEKIGKKLRFHINGGRVEMNGGPVINNLKGLFFHVYDKGHRLILHEWTPRKEFLEICAKMDIGMQVSFSETFNIVGADLISQGVPVVGSREIPWINPLTIASPTETEKIYKLLLRTHRFPQFNTKTNQYLLNRYTNKTKKIWTKYFN